MKSRASTSKKTASRGWIPSFKKIADRKSGTVRALRRLARRKGASYGTVLRRFYAWRQIGLAAFKDGRSGPHASTAIAARRVLVEKYARLHGKTFAQAMQALRRDLRAGRVNAGRRDPRTGIPRGFSLDNLRRIARHIPLRQVRLNGRAVTLTAAGSIILPA